MGGALSSNHISPGSIYQYSTTLCALRPIWSRFIPKPFLWDNPELMIFTKVYKATLDFNFWEGHSDTDINMLDSLIQLPIWQVSWTLYHIARSVARKTRHINIQILNRKGGRHTGSMGI